MTFMEQIRSFIPGCAQERADQALMLAYLQSDGELLTRNNPAMHMTASGWVVSPNRESVLMVYHNIYQSWSWIGGHADGDADLCAVAAREVREETGLSELFCVSPRIFSLELLAVAAHEKRGCHVSAHLHLNLTYLFEAEPGAPLRIKPDENSAVAWIPAHEVIERCGEPQMRPIYQKLLDRQRFSNFTD